LKRARAKRDEARKLIAEGIDPSAKRRRRRNGPMDAKTIARMTKRFETFVFPNLGSRPVRRITAPELLVALRRIEARGTHETAHRVRAACSRVFRYAIATGRAERDVAADLIGALVPVESRSFAAVTDPHEVAGLLRAIDSYRGELISQFALKLSPLVFVRPGELRKAEWAQIDFKGALWRIPWSRMKLGEQHLIPLSRQASALLKDLQELAHDERDDSRASYNHAQYLAARRKMMQAWADYLDTLRSDRTPTLVDNSMAPAPAQPRAA
jgi:integrase